MTGANVARAMQLSAPTVHEMIGRLERDGYITRGADKALAFTDNGREHAEGVVRRHRLIERFLTDVLGIPWDEVHEEAERLEHAMSPVLEERMLAAIGDAKTCPHGHPINVGERIVGVPLADVEVGAKRARAALRERGRGPAALPQGRRHRARHGGHGGRARRRARRRRGRRAALRADASRSPRRSRSSPTRRRRRAPRCPSSSCSPRTATGASRSAASSTARKRSASASPITIGGLTLSTLRPGPSVESSTARVRARSTTAAASAVAGSPPGGSARRR